MKCKLQQACTSEETTCHELGICIAAGCTQTMVCCWHIVRYILRMPSRVCFAACLAFATEENPMPQSVSPCRGSFLDFVVDFDHTLIHSISESEMGDENRGGLASLLDAEKSLLPQQRPCIVLRWAKMYTGSSCARLPVSFCTGWQKWETSQPSL